MAIPNQPDATAGQGQPQVAPAMTPPAQASVNQIPSAQPSVQGAAPALAAPMSPTAPTPTPMSATPGIAAASPTPTPAAPGLAPATPSATPSPNGGVALSSITPGASDLRTQNILPGADVDRYKLAQDRQATYLNAQEPVTRSASRSIFQDAASRGMAGPGGAGELRTNLGNLGMEEDREARNNLSGLLDNATEGTIQDARNNRAEYRTERGYNDGLENQAYNRGVQGVQLGDQLTNSAYGRGAGNLAAGSAGNPSSTELGLAGMYGQQASDAGNSLGQMVQSNNSNNILSSIYGAAKPMFSGGGSQAPQVSPNNGLLSSIYGDG